MIKTSTAYQAAIVGSPRRIELLAVVDISDPDMEYGAVTMDSQTPWSKPEEIHDKVLTAPARYATLEPGRWLLDGSFDIFPDDYQVSEHIGACGGQLSDEAGYFQRMPRRLFSWICPRWMYCRPSACFFIRPGRRSPSGFHSGGAERGAGVLYQDRDR